MAPPEVEGLMEPLTRAYRESWGRVVAEQEAIAADPARWRRARVLRESRERIELEMARLRQVTPGLVHDRLPAVYEAGARVGAPAPIGWAQPQREAVARMAGGLEGELLAATHHVSDTTRRLVRSIARDEQLHTLIAGGTAKQAGRRVASLVKSNGIHAVRYSNGARHGLAEYADMAVRTQTGLAYNRGALDNARAHDVRYVEVFDGPNCGWDGHNDATMADGLIVPVEESYGFELSHPNCQRSLSGRPDVRTPDQARDATRSTTAAQREDMRAALTSRHDAKLAARRKRLADRAERVGAPAPPRRFTDTEEAKAYRDQFDVTADLTYEENGTLTRYTGASFRRINEGLRSGEPLTKAVQRDVDDMHAAFGKARALDEDVVVHRGIDEMHPVAVHAESGKLQPGAVIRDDGFLSTSLDTQVAEEFALWGKKGGYRFELTATRGTRTLAGDRFESELIFNSGTRFEITEVDQAARIIRGRIPPDE